MTLRVLHVTQPTDRDGVPVFVRNCAEAQVRRGFNVAVACPDGGDLPTKLDEKGIFRLAWSAKRGPSFSTVTEAIALKRLVRRWVPDVVHLHSSKAGLAGRLRKLRGPAVVFQPHAWSFEHVTGVMGRAALAWERVAAGRCDAVICVSEGERKRGIEQGIRGDLRVIPNGVPLDRWSPAGEAERASARQELQLPVAPIAVCVGRLSAQKGQDVLLSAWGQVIEEVPNARLILVGEGPARADLARRAVPGVSFQGTTNDVWSWLAAADVVAMPSRWEGMSLSMLETMATGRALVATDVAGVREAMGDSAAIVPVEDADSLANALVRRLNDPGLAREEGLALRARVENRFGFDETEAAIALLYGDLLEHQAKA